MVAYNRSRFPYDPCGRNVLHFAIQDGGSGVVHPGVHPDPR
ncbi:MAG: hypothetical protein U1F77_04355 [Kiritimatiellia bacterium]